MTTLHLSRVRLRDDASVGALAGLLLDENGDAHAAKVHRLIWSLFADEPGRQRDFLWRDDGGEAWRRRTFLTLSARPPQDAVRLFDFETKPFAPVLAPGQRLRFRLRASPSINLPDPSAKRGKRKDPVSVALNKLPEKGRTQRDDVIQQVGRAWLERQGARTGFTLTEPTLLRVDGEDHRALPRSGMRDPIRFSVLDFEGLLEVTDPALFLTGLAKGFGRAKAFGCGLMLIRSA
jgi:CRISPR system Cascade subunit CasE